MPREVFGGVVAIHTVRDGAEMDSRHANHASIPLRSRPLHCRSERLVPLSLVLEQAVS